MFIKAGNSLNLMVKTEKLAKNLEVFKDKNNYIPWLIGGIFLILIVFTFLSEKVLFSDVPQYLAVGKEFAGVSHAKVRNTPGWLYGWFIGQVLKVMPSLNAVKVLNLVWFSLTLLLLFLMSKRIEVLFLYLTSPLIWYLAPWINPLSLISFLFLIAYYFFNKYKLVNLIFGGLILGLATAIWWPAFYFSIFFFLSFLYDRKFLDVIFVIISFLATFFIRILFDWYYFSMLFFSTLRGLGSNLSFLIGEAPDGLPEHSILKYLIILVIISPLLYRLIFVNWVEKRKTGIFLVLCLILFLFNFQFRFFIAIMPIIILLISKNVSKKELILGLVASVVIVALLTTNYFLNNNSIIVEDLKQIENDLPSEKFIVGYDGGSEEEASYLDTLYWGEKIKEFIRYSEYKLGLKGEDLFREYKFESKSKINNLRELELSLKYLRTDLRVYSNVNYWILIGDKGNVDSDFELFKVYKALKVFKRVGL